MAAGPAFGIQKTYTWPLKQKAARRPREQTGSEREVVCISGRSWGFGTNASVPWGRRRWGAGIVRAEKDLKARRYVLGIWEPGGTSKFAMGKSKL